MHRMYWFAGHYMYLTMLQLLSMQAIENDRNLVALSCSIKLVNAIVSAEKRETPITDVKTNQLLIIKGVYSLRV